MSRTISVLLILFIAAFAGCEDTIIVEDLTGDDLVDPSIQPRVIYTYPPGGSGPFQDFSSDVLVRFNKLMDPTSLRRAVRIVSPSGGLSIDPDRIPSSAGNIHSFHVVRTDPARTKTWWIGESYTIVIDTTAFDVNGNPLRPGFSMTFTPEPFFRITSTSPDDGAAGVSVRSKIQISFNNSIDRTGLGHIRITPGLPGGWNFIKTGSPPTDSSRIRYDISDEPSLPSGTVYTIEVDSAFSDVEGHTLRQPFSWSFSTVPFGIARSTPTDGSMEMDPFYSQVGVYFTEGIEPESIPSSISLDPAVPWSA